MRLSRLLILMLLFALCQGKGGGRGGSRGGNSGKKGSSTSGSGGSSVTTPALSNGGSTTEVSGRGGDKPVVIPNGPFAGRQSGGGTRNQIYGNSLYGSGYPGVNGLGVARRNFPFNFWPIVWYLPLVYTYPPYLSTQEYGTPDNPDRPGGILMSVAFGDKAGASTFRFIADNATIVALTPPVMSACRSYLVNAATNPSPSPYLTSDTTLLPQEAAQYYRGSSAVLLVDGYNNTATFDSNPNASSSPFPQSISSELLTCLNKTIGSAIPLVQVKKSGLSPSAITGMVIGSFFGALVLYFLISGCASLIHNPCCRRSRSCKNIEELTEEISLQSPGISKLEANATPPYTATFSSHLLGSPWVINPPRST